MMGRIIYYSMLLSVFAASCTPTRSNRFAFKHDRPFDDSLQQIIRDCLLDSTFNAGEDGMETVSFAVIDLNGKKPVLGGVHMDNFIYPASVYKMYVAMEVLKQISEGKY